MKFEIYNSTSGYRWRFKGGNGEIVASGEGYTTKANCENAVNLLKSTNANTPVVYVDK